MGINFNKFNNLVRSFQNLINSGQISPGPAPDQIMKVQVQQKKVDGQSQEKLNSNKPIPTGFKPGDAKKPQPINHNVKIGETRSPISKPIESRIAFWEKVAAKAPKETVKEFIGHRVPDTETKAAPLKSASSQEKELSKADAPIKQSAPLEKPERATLKSTSPQEKDKTLKLSKADVPIKQSAPLEKPKPASLTPASAQDKDSPIISHKPESNKSELPNLQRPSSSEPPPAPLSPSTSSPLDAPAAPPPPPAPPPPAPGSAQRLPLTSEEPEEIVTSTPQVEVKRQSNQLPSEDLVKELSKRRAAVHDEDDDYEFEDVVFEGDKVEGPKIQQGATFNVNLAEHAAKEEPESKETGSGAGEEEWEAGNPDE